MKSIFAYGVCAMLMFVFMQMMMSAWDKEYEYERQKIESYKAQLAADAKRLGNE